MNPMEILFFSTSVIFLLMGSYFHIGTRYKTIYDKISTIIYFTASLIYATMGLLYLDNPYFMIRAFRYLDWVITIPLLLYQFYLFLHRNKRNPIDILTLIFLSFLMLMFGFLGEIHWMDKHLANVLGILPAIYMFYLIFSKSKKTDRSFFILMSTLWLFYPIVYLLEETNVTLVLWSIIDIITKIGTGLFIRHKKSINLKKLT